MLPETECPGLHTRYAKTDNYFRDLLLISYRKGSFNYLSVSATWVLQPESEINDNGTAKNCYCQRILHGKCWRILMMGSSTIAETDGQTDHPDLKVAGGHACSLVIQDWYTPPSSGARRLHSTPALCGHWDARCICLGEKSLEKALFMSFLQFRPEWKITSLGFSVKEKWAFFVWISKWKSCFFFLLTDRIGFISFLNPALPGLSPSRQRSNKCV